MYISSKMAKTKEYYYEQLKNSVESKGGRLISPVYTLSTAYYDYTCAANHPCKARPSQIKDKPCKECNKLTGKSYEEIFREAVGLKGGTVIESYNGSNTWVQCAEIEHPPWYARVPDVRNGHWCKKCAGLCPEDSEKKFRKQVETRGGKMIGVYAGNKILVDLLCEFNHKFSIRPNDVNDGHWCSWCVDCSPDQAAANVKLIVERQGGKMLSPYINNHTPMLIECEKDHEFWAHSKAIQNMKWCDICGETSYEKQAREFLETNNISMKSQFGIPELPRKKFDFYFEYNGFKYLLEVDGEQHFMFKSIFHKTAEGFRYNQHIDALKSRAAIEFGYRLIRIDWSEIPNIAYHMTNALNGNYSSYLSSNVKYSYLFESIPSKIITEHSKPLATKLGIC
jgi:hypothetical protein